MLYNTSVFRSGQKKLFSYKLAKKEFIFPVRLLSSFFLFLLFFSGNALFAQSKKLNGKVSSAEGIGLQGASVQVKTTNISTIAGKDGAFELTLPSSVKSIVLVFSYVGFAEKEVKVDDASKEVNVALAADNKSNLQDVVVIGYGSQKKKDLTGSVTSVKRADFENQPLLDVSQTLKGLAPGVAVSQSSGAPGADIKIRIRGVNSILGNNSPLLVIDGVQSDINLNQLNPNDIETIDVLKDASATAIYGSRGANGVVLITTKRGTKSGLPLIEVNMFSTLSKRANKFDILGAFEYAKQLNLLSPGSYSKEDLDYFEAFGGTDWQDVLLQDGIVNSLNFSASGGSAGSTYLISGNYIDEQGMVIGTKRKRYNLRSNLQTKITEKISVGLNLSGSFNNGTNISQSYTELWDAVNWSPTELVYEDDGTYNRSDLYGSIRRNPYMNLKEQNFNSRGFLGIVGANLTYKILPNLTFNTLLGVNYNAGNFAYAANEFIDPNISASQSNFNSTFWQTSSTLTYQKLFKNIHNMTLMAGFEQQKSESNSFRAGGTNFLLSSTGYYNLGLAPSASIGSSFSDQSLRSYFGRGTYSYKDRYLFTATYRADGSSKFRGDNKYSFFPSAAIAWRMSEETFIKNLNVFNTLKLRTSWGITGNQAISPYATLPLLTPFGFSYGGNAEVPGYLLQGSGNPNLRWEETQQYDIGLDAGLLKNRINITVDYYNKKTKGLLQATKLPDYAGGGTVIKNIGEMLNSGIDIGLSAVPVQSKNFNWNAAINFSLMNNKIASLGEEDQIFPPRDEYYVFESPNSHVLKVGQPMGAFWGVQHLGIWQQGETAKAAEYGNKPGDNKYLDLNNDKKIDGSDFAVVGNSLPKYRLGFNNTITYKNFTFNFFAEMVSGFKVFNGQFASAAIPSSDGRTITLKEGTNYWTLNNQSAKYANPLSSSSLNFPQSTQWLQDGSFLRLRNISLNYNIGKDKLKFANIKVYGSVQNLVTLTKFVGADPEGTVSNSSDTYGGYSAGSFPSARSFTIGIIFTN